MARDPSDGSNTIIGSKALYTTTKAGGAAQDARSNDWVQKTPTGVMSTLHHDEPLDTLAVDHNASPGAPLPKACLAMIMKNEGPILPRLFESIKGFVSEYCIVDTGSTDDTIQVLKSIDMPGVLIEEPFVNFAVSRNFLLNACRAKTDCDYLVLLDADMVLKVSPEWDWAKLDGKDVYNFIQISSVEYENVRMVRRTADKVQVVGATHEYYDVPPEYSRGLIPKHLVYIDDISDGKAKGDKFQRDERLLRAELEAQPNNTRTVFYLANTLKDQGKCHEAIPFYQRRTTMGGWFAEADYSLIMLSSCYLELDDLDNARKYAEMAAFTGTTKRAEPLYYLAAYLHRHGHYELAWYYVTLAETIPKPEVSAALFIGVDIYNYWLAYERVSLCPLVFPMEHRYCLQGALNFLNSMVVPNNLLDYYYPNLGVLAPTLAAISEDWDGTYAIQGDGAAITAVRIEPTGSVQLLLHKGEHRATVIKHIAKPYNADVLEQQAKVVVVHGPSTPTQLRHLSGTNELAGFSPNGTIMYLGEWRDHEVHFKALMTPPFEARASDWALFQDQEGPVTAGTTYCITSWYPTIDIGLMKIDEGSGSVTCEQHKSMQGIPRSFLFFETASYGVRYKADTWFLVRSSTADASMHAMVMLDRDHGLKSYTYPFKLGNETTPERASVRFGISASEERKLMATFAYVVEQAGKRFVRVEQVELSQILSLIVA